MSRPTAAQLKAQLATAQAETATLREELATERAKRARDRYRDAPLLPLEAGTLFRAPMEPGNVWCILEVETSRDYMAGLRRYLNIHIRAQEVTG